MALNVQTFKTRSLTAAVFVIIMLAGLLWNIWSFIALFTIIHFGCWYEFIKLTGKINGKKNIYYLPLGVPYITMPILMILSLGIKIIVYTPPPLPTEIIYVVLLPCTIIFSIWINDTMAYIVGSFIGKTPFSKISPKKTWEGTIGGAVLAVAVIGLSGSHISIAKTIAPVHYFFIAAICAVFGTLGDLLESKIKRMAEVKDSGSIMPGHGGFLDRFDSLLIATPFVWLYAALFMH